MKKQNIGSSFQNLSVLRNPRRGWLGSPFPESWCRSRFSEFGSWIHSRWSHHLDGFTLGLLMVPRRHDLMAASHSSKSTNERDSPAFIFTSLGLSKKLILLLFLSTQPPQAKPCSFSRATLWKLLQSTHFNYDTSGATRGSFSSMGSQFSLKHFIW